ncbi:MAG: PCMD domain-containing protein [Muribaculaceae bacterium]|nr:PCMD domain-containing protein [Muribaculaceae bacterium]
MKKLFNIILSGFIASIVLVGCQSEEALTGEGKVSFKVAINENVATFARDGESDNLAENCTIYVYNSSSLIRKYHGVSELPSELVLVSGDYKAVAWAGDSVPASYTAKYYKGTSPFSIEKGASVQTTIECKIANTVASATIDQAALNALTDYTITIGHSKGTLDFTSENIATAKGYYMMPANETDLSWTISGTQSNGNPFTQQGVIENVKKATEYTLNFTYNPTEVDYGGGFLIVTVDESEIVVNDNMVLVPAPKFSASGFEISSPVYSEQGGMSKLSVYAAADGKLTSLKVSCDYFSELGFPSDNFDFITMTSTASESIATLGVTNVLTYNEEAENTISKISFAKELLNRLPNGSYIIKISATDSHGKTSELSVDIEISDASVMTLPIAASDLHQYSATIRANIAKEGVTGCGFKYRKQGESSWTTVAGTVEGNSYYAKLTGLTSSTTYQYVAITSDYTAQNIYDFTTGAVVELPNGGFENWFTDGDGALVPSVSSDQLLWDTGNHGSITLKVNITNPDESVKHSGNYSVKMQSAYVALLGIGKFAAGNIFVGKYLNTDGTNGVLGFGRQFAARPKALHGYVKYRPGTINYTNSEVPDATGTDKGVIYIGMLDNTTESYNGSAWPFIIKTKKAERRLFNKDESKVVGYGEVIYTTSTEGEGMVEFTIPIDYKSDAIPSAMVIVGSASYYGDYFAGSTDSVMWLDDLELVYE